MYRVLVIEDEADLRENILDLLQAEGFEAVGAENGQIGVQLAQKLLPDLVICDILMPELNGHLVLMVLRQNPETALIPFIFLTAKGTVEDFRTGLKLGADDYLVKPFQQAELLEAINLRLTKYTIVQQLQQQVETLQQSNEDKDEFLSVVSHELRGPMTNIRLAIQMLQRSAKNSSQQKYLDLLQTECSREIALLNDLLDLQRLETNLAPPVPEVIDLPSWIAAIVKSFEVRMQNRQQHLTLELIPNLSSFSSNASDLGRILTELLNNACKYTAPGGAIHLSVHYPDSSQIHDSLQITVGNQATIPAEAIPHLFERFYRAPGGDRWRQGGTGLGLALVRQLVEHLGGTIQVSSKDDWTQFIVRLPQLLQLPHS